MTWHLEVLPPPQADFWHGPAARVPRHFVLYGGTAIALHLGHRVSVDFDFFSDRPLDPPGLHAALPELDVATVLLADASTLVVAAGLGAASVKLSFFGGLRIGRVADPLRADNGVAIAAPLDLLATKLKTLHDRVEARDYIDIEALLRAGLRLDQGLAAAMALFGPGLNPLDTAKAVGWFKDGGLEAALPETSRRYLATAAAGFDPAVSPLPIRSRSLAG